MIKNNKIFSIITAGLLLAGSACTDFGDINVDPNQPSNAPTSLLLTDAQTWVATAIGAPEGVLYTQQLSETQYTETSRYNQTTFDYYPWYTGPLANLQQIINLNTDDATKNAAAADGSNNNQIAVARIMKAYFFQYMTDRWGALPYSEALQGAANFNPAYDTQDKIYADLLKEVKEAVAMIDAGAGPNGDIIFGGDMGSWAAFGNTLRMNMAMRISDIDPATARSEFEAAYNAGVISTDVMYNHLNDANNQNPWYGRFITRTDYAVSEPMINYLQSVNDPRISAYAEPALATGTFVGMPYGISTAGDIPNSDVSFITDNIINTKDADQAIFTVAQVEFLLAEAVNDGWSIPGTAQQHYEAGIQASWEQWGVFDAAAFATYIADAAVVWNGTNADQLIGTQKWVALYMQGYEAWAEWRRLDFPALTPAPDAVNNSGQIPVRQAYPSTEYTLNKANYESIVAAQGADNLDNKLWWDTK
ncbi:MAG: SusD/RagB family nutrient-binding outer membrane lipoprotein [Cyclobacteriaceae bacterium]|nr:SusD/RagB family nutrient-binding outer membrane lipoprotein [Cyclobacteriaceae bacterium]